MSYKHKIGLLTGLVLAAATGAHAQNRCVLSGQQYPENAMVCVGGLVNYCTNGVWQTSDGARCDAPTGSYIGPTRPLQQRNTEPVPEFYKEKYPDLNLP